VKSFVGLSLFDSPGFQCDRCFEKALALVRRTTSQEKIESNECRPFYDQISFSMLRNCVQAVVKKVVETQGRRYLSSFRSPPPRPLPGPCFPRWPEPHWPEPHWPHPWWPYPWWRPGPIIFPPRSPPYPRYPWFPRVPDYEMPQLMTFRLKLQETSGREPSRAQMFG